ncbi:hypothetical protein ACFLUO_09150 [Chloroflexota bacterium]
MVKLKTWEALGRKKFREHELLSELGIPDWEMVYQSIKAGKTDEALEWLKYVEERSLEHCDSMSSFINNVLTYLASLGEEHIFTALRDGFYSRAKLRLSVGRSAEEMVQLSTDAQRRHHAELQVTEEPDRFVVRYDQCGTGGRLRRIRKDVGVTSKAYPWSWGKAGVPYYCCHCAILWEIIPIELRGYPGRVNLIAEKPEDPCIHLFYKKPELIPEEYFTKVGKTKTIK